MVKRRSWDNLRQITIDSQQSLVEEALIDQGMDIRGRLATRSVHQKCFVLPDGPKALFQFQPQIRTVWSK